MPRARNAWKKFMEISDAIGNFGHAVDAAALKFFTNLVAGAKELFKKAAMRVKAAKEKMKKIGPKAKAAAAKAKKAIGNAAKVAGQALLNIGKKFDVDIKKIAKNYLYGWFVIDFVSVFPFDIFLKSGKYFFWNISILLMDISEVISYQCRLV